MSEFKFACPACGQHITCDSAKSGSSVECPTCFQQLIVPHAPQSDGSKFILNASLASSRRFVSNETKIPVTIGGPSARGKFRVLAISFGLMLCAGLLFTFREKIFQGSSWSGESNSSTSARSTVTDTNWTLNLAGVAMPDAPAIGRINRQTFTVDRAILRGGMLDLRQGSDVPPELGLSIALFAKQGEELAGQSISIAVDRTNAPKAFLIFKNNQGQFIGQPFAQGYALRLEFGQVANGYLTGKIYFCAPDPTKSWVAGSFEAEIRAPTPKSRPPRPPGQKR